MRGEGILSEGKVGERHYGKVEHLMSGQCGGGGKGIINPLKGLGLLWCHVSSGK